MFAQEKEKENCISLITASVWSRLFATLLLPLNRWGIYCVKLFYLNSFMRKMKNEEKEIKSLKENL